MYTHTKYDLFLYTFCYAYIDIVLVIGVYINVYTHASNTTILEHTSFRVDCMSAHITDFIYRKKNHLPRKTQMIFHAKQSYIEPNSRKCINNPIHTMLSLYYRGHTYMHVCRSISTDVHVCMPSANNLTSLDIIEHVCRYISTGEVGGWGRDPFSRNFMKPTPRRKWYLTTGRRFH